MTNSGAREKSAGAYRTISEVADSLKLPQHVLRFWETRFAQIKPMKRGGNRRYYRPEDVELLAAIRQLLYGEGYTIKGVQRLLRENGPRALTVLAQGGAGPAGEPSAIAADAAAPPRSPDRGEAERGVDAAGPSDAFSGDPVTRLRAVLASLTDCRRILDAARA